MSQLTACCVSPVVTIWSLSRLSQATDDQKYESKLSVTLTSQDPDACVTLDPSTVLLSEWTPSADIDQNTHTVICRNTSALWPGQHWLKTAHVQRHFLTTKLNMTLVKQKLHTHHEVLKAAQDFLWYCDFTVILSFKSTQNITTT